MSERVTNPAKPAAAKPRQAPHRQVDPPPRFRVLLHNNHYTTMDFVVYVLESVFQKAHYDAVRIMLAVHKKGIGLCGIFCAEVAETKVTTVRKLARNNGYPLRCSMEPE
ncbi:MAG: ATP-dependent Clp protease adaptor ClpS [Candidatus Hydrogenedentes bacterium]|nr:ATP-dependent Clp protease adaptor ClpS [Candidatus Hydrogenedentota bacterium]